MAPVMEHTSVRPWALKPTIEPIDTNASHCTILSYSADDAARCWAEELTTLGIEHHITELAPWNPSIRDETLAGEQQIITEELDLARVGWRLLIAGAMVDVLRSRAFALEAGLLDDEVIVGTTSVEFLPVTCAHCHHITVQRTAIDNVITCSNCHESLLVYHHVSRRQGSFLGFKVNAETWEPADVHS